MDAVPAQIVELLAAWMQDHCVQSVTFHCAPDYAAPLKVEAKLFWTQYVGNAELTSR